MAVTLPYRFDTADVWRTILKGAIGLNAVLLVGIVHVALVRRKAATTVGLVVCELLVLGFTRIFVRFQTGSTGVLTKDRLVIEPNVLLGIALPGPRGEYALDRFAAIRVEHLSGRPDVQSGTGPHELVWLVGRPGTPDVVLARTREGAGRDTAQDLANLLALPIEETGQPIVVRL